MLTVLDIENSVTRKVYTDRNGETSTHIDLSPYCPSNFLVSVGYNDDPLRNPNGSEYICFRHAHNDHTIDGHKKLEYTLAHTELLIGHNIKHDLSWLRECGFIYDGAVWDTQIAEYILCRGIKKPLNLKAVLERYSLPGKRTDLTDEYLSAGIGFETMPWNVVEEYGRADVISTSHLFNKQREIFTHPRNAGLLPTFHMMCSFMHVLIEMEKNGLKINFEVLDELKNDYIKEYAELDARLHEIAASVMGDTPIQLTSPEFRSKLIYSRIVKDKKEWKKVFNIGKDQYGKDLKRPYMKPKEFNAAVRGLTHIASRTLAVSCTRCGGNGSYQRIRKDGTPWKNKSNCPFCTDGIVYKPTGQTAGFRMIPKGTSWVAQGGFATDKDTLDLLADDSTGIAAEFFEKMRRFNAISTYLNTFVEQIYRFTDEHGILRTSLNQTITATGRLSSSQPNLHNQPRGGTFPVRKVVKSRFDGGKIGEADYGQLEYRIAGCLSGSKQIYKDVCTGFDVHSYTRDVINNFDASLPQIDRQDAKQNTFKPLYGGLSGTPREVAYYKAFLERTDVGAWHEALKNQALTRHRIAIPSGREYDFPNAKRLQGGYVKDSTKIVNYPVQGYATGDIVPLGAIATFRRWKAAKLKSLLILTVHDSLEADIFPGEEDQMIDIMLQGMLDIPAVHLEFYNKPFNYPLMVEAKTGGNWLQMKIVRVLQSEDLKCCAQDSLETR